ncbi:hypothetical protein OJAV_G00223770 [Oryzias javanicus]|uniref:Uncharacterized protein n=1 Tax=Oryzias javanicus TaxID=123683 RepID=A0A437C2L5_ORYJA|nr:hypothetical protein OJAV_G00223770 [Oryzias javanicus]
MGNLPLSTGLFKTDETPPKPDGDDKYVARRICNSIIYYSSPIKPAGSHNLCSAKDSQPPPPSDDSSSLLSETQTDPTISILKQSRSRPLLVFFSWLGAQPVAVAKYRNLYLERGMDVLLVQSSVMHFLWPRWGLDYGLEVLHILEEPPFSGRDVLVHASSIGGYTFTQVLTHIAQEPKRHDVLAQRVIGHIYDSLVVGSLEHMATGLGKTLLPRLEGFIKNTAMLYFWLFKTHTADFYENSIQVFHRSPVTSPALFFFSENDAMCNPAVLEKLIDFWKRRGVSVNNKRWKESKHAAHLRCHPEEYLSTLQHFLNSLPASSLTATI